MKKLIIRALLAILNSRYLNHSPCQFKFCGNVDAFDIANLRSEVAQRPNLTVAQLIAEAERFASCPVNPKGLTVLEADGLYHDADVWELHQLRQALTKDGTAKRKDGLGT